MKQLPLFETSSDASEQEAGLPGSEDVLDSSSSDSDQGQLRLFAQRTLRLKHIGDAIAEGRLEEAHHGAVALRASAPDDGNLRKLAETIEERHAKLQAAEALDPPARAAELLALARSLDAPEGAWASLRLWLLRRVGEVIRGSLGDGGELEGQPAGYYLLEAGAFADAKASLAAAASVDHQHRARILFLLADAATALDDPSAGRAYLEALLVDPFDPAFASVRDPAVRALPDVARDDFEIEEVPEAWSAPAGILTGVLPSPLTLSAGVYTENKADAEHGSEQREALSRARQFVGALVAVSSTTRPGEGAILEARRTMKRLCPTLFATYLRRMT